MGRHQGRFGALGRCLIVGLISLVTFAPESPALATSPVCEQTWSQVADWSKEEAVRGLTAARLDRLHQLTPLMVECSRIEPGREGMGFEAEPWRALVGVYFDPGDVDRVICLMEKESDGNPDARNPASGASGLMQVMPSWAEVFGYTPEQLFDPTVNLYVASQIREQQGWGAWTPFLRGSCR